MNDYYHSVLCLALDTSTAGGSCALTRDEVVVRERRGDVSRPHDVRLPGDLMSLLDDEGLALDDVELYAVVTGPGSFTGLRIGIAAMQGLALAANRPLVGVSGFDALAALASTAESSAAAAGIATWVDAWRGDVFAARYQNGMQVDEPTVESPRALLDRIDAPTLFVGDGAALYADLIVGALGARAQLAVPAVPALAGVVGRLAVAAAGSGHAPPPDQIRPLYVRRPDAELARDARPTR